MASTAYMTAARMLERAGAVARLQPTITRPGPPLVTGRALQRIAPPARPIHVHASIRTCSRAQGRAWLMDQGRTAAIPFPLDPSGERRQFRPNSPGCSLSRAPPGLAARQVRGGKPVEGRPGTRRLLALAVMAAVALAGAGPRRHRLGRSRCGCRAAPALTPFRPRCTPGRKSPASHRPAAQGSPAAPGHRGPAAGAPAR